MSQSTWMIDPSHSSVGFSIKHMMISRVSGSFDKFSAKLVYDPAQPSKATVEATLEAASLNTRDGQRDARLRSPDFFDVEKFPTLSFRSTQIVRDGEELRVSGELTIHGVTKTISLRVEGPTGEQKDPWGQIKIGAFATTSIKRKDFGLTWNKALEAGGFLVGDDVVITLELQFVKQG